MEKVGSAPNSIASAGNIAPSKMNGPLWVNAEITYKCPLHCVFCYNPIDYTQYGPELTTEDWLRALRRRASWAPCSSASPAVSR